MEYEWVVIGQGLLPLDKSKVDPNDLEPSGFFKISAVLSHADAAHLQSMPFRTKIRRVPIGAHPAGPVAKAAAVKPEASDMPKPPVDAAPVDAPPVAPAAPVAPVTPTEMPKPPTPPVPPKT